MPEVNIAAGFLTLLPPQEDEARLKDKSRLKNTAMTSAGSVMASPFQAHMITVSSTCLGLWRQPFGRALQTVLALETHDLRQFGIGKHQNIDDTPAGGGAGMVLRADKGRRCA